jgi:hypothetical protein
MRRRRTAPGLTCLAAGPALAASDALPRRGRRLHADDFRHGLDQWVLEAEKPAKVGAQDGVLDIDTPAGLTLWFRPELIGPVMIQYQAQAVSAGGPQRPGQRSERLLDGPRRGWRQPTGQARARAPSPTTTP